MTVRVSLLGVAILLASIPACRCDNQSAPPDAAVDGGAADVEPADGASRDAPTARDGGYPPDRDIVADGAPQADASAGEVVYFSNYGVVGDGSDEAERIEEACAAGVSAGLPVHCTGGMVITTTQLRFPEGVTVVGNGCTLKLKDHHHTDGEMWQWIYVEPGVSIHGMVFDGNRQNGNGANTYGLMLQGDNVFDGNTVKNVFAYTISVYGDTPSNIQITNNAIFGSQQYGISTGCTDGEYCYGHNLTITGNTIYDCAEVGIKIRGTVDALVANNYITVGARRQRPDGSWGDEPSGIRLYTWDEPNWNITIEDNIVEGLDEDPSDCICSDEASDNHGIIIRRNTVSHCQNGLRLNLDDAVITDNAVSSCAHCYTVDGTGNTESGNTLSDCPNG